MRSSGLTIFMVILRMIPGQKWSGLWRRRRLCEMRLGSTSGTLESWMTKVLPMKNLHLGAFVYDEDFNKMGGYG